MIYEQKIIPENGGYKGVLLANNEVVFTTTPCSSLKEAAEKLKERLSNLNSPQSKAAVSFDTAPFSHAPINPVPNPAPRCCGR